MTTPPILITTTVPPCAHCHLLLPLCPPVHTFTYCYHCAPLCTWSPTATTVPPLCTAHGHLMLPLCPPVHMVTYCYHCAPPVYSTRSPNATTVPPCAHGHLLLPLCLPVHSTRSPNATTLPPVHTVTYCYHCAPPPLCTWYLLIPL